ncbi:MAG TPA: prepilin-type N-terminal cleavage/methylation domain-containing protein [Opitutaceae bacterium]
MSPAFLDPPFARAAGPARHRAFTLVEVMVVVAIVSVVAAIGMPAVRRVALTARATAAANDLRVFAAAFQGYSQQNANYPPNAGIGVMPPAMSGSLGSTAWLRITPIGGRYKWNNNANHAGTRYRASISIRTQGRNRVTTDQAQLIALDRRIDDGNLAAGAFFLGAGNEPVFIIER